VYLLGMRKIFLAAALLAAPACTKADQQADKLQTVSVDAADKAIAAGQAQAVDANGVTTRKRMGVVPGAVLLTDSESFAISELPSDKGKPLVFYCANTECSASHQAAQKAMTAGYQHVEVMPDGIAGWVKAGKKTQTI
jgi:rhodanese-related sulfurtransferase